MMKKRIRLCRAVEPNQGVRALYARRLKALQGAFQRHVLEQILLHLDATGTLAMDLSLSRPKTPAEKARLEALRRKVLSSMARANPGRVQEDIDKFVSEHLAEWTGSFTSEARKLCTWLVQSTFTHTTRAQREALHAAGLSRGQMRAKWTVPIVHGQYVSPAAAQAVRGLVEENAGLITKISAADVERIAQTVGSGLSQGMDFDALKRELRKTQGFDDARAERVALDQTAKLSQAVQRENAKAVGLTRAVWVHVPGKYTSRETHIAMNGKQFDLDEGLYDPEVGRKVLPGELPYCRCVYRLVMPQELLDDD